MKVSYLNARAFIFLGCLGSLILFACSGTSKKSGASASAQAAYSEKVRDLPESAKRETKTSYQLPPFDERVLANGMTILFVPDDKLPYISLSLMIRAGSVQDPEGLAGLSSMVAELLDKGTQKRTAPQIAGELGQMGAEFDAAAAMEYTLVSASSLSMQAEPLLQNVLEIVTAPTFSEKEIERMRKQILAGIARRVDSPEIFTEMAFDSFLFGTHPYGRAVSGTQASVMAIKKKNIIQQYLRYYRPNNSILAVVGKYTPEFAREIEERFGAWQSRDVSKTVYPTVPPFSGVQIELVDKPGAVQAQIKFGNLGISRKNDDYVAIRAANTILGGAFSSRLTDRIRQKLGLTYSISSSFDARLDRGPFEISTFTKNNSTGQTVSETLKVLSDFRDQGVSQFEVDMTKGYLKGVFPTNIETAEKLAFNLMILRFNGIPDSYLTGYLSTVDHLSVSEINQVIKKYFDDKNIKIVVYGNASEVRPQLEPIARAFGGELIVKNAGEIQ